GPGVAHALGDIDGGGQRHARAAHHGAGLGVARQPGVHGLGGVDAVGAGHGGGQERDDRRVLVDDDRHQLARGKKLSCFTTGPGATSESSLRRPKASSPSWEAKMTRVACSWVSAKVISVRGSCSVTDSPSSLVEVVVIVEVVPTPSTRTRCSSVPVYSGWSVPASSVKKTATCEPGVTKPATRAGSVRLTDTAIIPSGIASVVLSTAPEPNLLEVICSSGKI